MDHMPRVELFELYGMLLAGVSAVRRMLERADDASGPTERGSPDQVMSGRDDPPHHGGAQDATTGEVPAAEPTSVGMTPGDIDRAEVVASVERMRQAMLEALFVLDFVVVHRRLDSLMLRRVRTAVVGGIDSADACLAEEAAGVP